MPQHKVFISYFHRDDQLYKDELTRLNKIYDIYIDGSVDIGDIDDTYMTDEQIRIKIRDDYLKDTSVTILLVGKETKNRKHIDWELYSSMRDGAANKKSGILIIQLPTINPSFYRAAHTEEKSILYPYTSAWTSITSRSEYERRYPYLSDRVIDNLLAKNVKISVTRWSDLNLGSTGEKLRLLIDLTFDSRKDNEYDMTRQMKRRNS